MCDPLSLTALGLSVGGSVMNGMAENQAAKARSAVLDAERTRQRGLESRQSALSDQSQQQMADFTGDQAQRTADLTSYFQEPVAGDANAESGTVAPEGTSSITVREMGKQSQAATDKTNQSAAALAGVRAFGDLLGDKMRGVQRNSSSIDQLTGFRRGSTDALAYELDAAAQKGAGKRFLGDILGGAGSVLGGYGAMAGASNPVVTGMLGGGTDNLAAALRSAGAPARNARTGIFSGLLG